MANERHGLTRNELHCPLSPGQRRLNPSSTRNFGVDVGFARRLPSSSQAVPPDWQLNGEELLEEIVSRAFLFFWNEAGKRTGLVRDTGAGRQRPRQAAHRQRIAATGFSLSALCIGHERGYLPAHQIRTRVVNTLSFLLNHVEHVNGIFYHFIDLNTGKRVRSSEVSPIDTTILLCGVLTARAYFHDPVISRLATKLYARVNWRWMLNGGKTFALRAGRRNTSSLGARMGYLLRADDDVYLLAIAAPVYNIDRAGVGCLCATDGGIRRLQLHQRNRSTFLCISIRMSWFDFRKQRDAYADYFQNSAITTFVHQQFVFRCVGAIRTMTRTPGALPLPTPGLVTRFGAGHRRLDILTELWYRVAARKDRSPLSAAGYDQLA